MNWLWRALGKGRGDSLGERGEQAAETWLKRQGYTILERNREVGDDEADLIALDPDGRTLVVVEVKTRSDEGAMPELAMTAKKRFRLSRLAARLLRDSRYRDRALRFDVIAVVWPAGQEPQIRHHPGAFQSPW